MAHYSAALPAASSRVMLNSPTSARPSEPHHRVGETDISPVSACGGSPCADAQLRRRVVPLCSPRMRRNCPRTRTIWPRCRSSPSHARMWVQVRSRNHRSWEITTAQPGKLTSAFSSELRVSTSRSLVGSSSRIRFPPCLSVSARFSRLRSPPDSTPAGFCWSGPLKPNADT